MTPAILLAALIEIFPQSPAHACLIERRVRIVAQVEESIRAYPTLRPELLIAVAFSETHLGCDAHEGGGWGAPISPTRRHVAGTHMHAARILARSLEVCRTERAALRRFRTGMCTPSNQTRSIPLRKIAEMYASRTLRIAERISR